MQAKVSSLLLEETKKAKSQRWREYLNNCHYLTLKILKCISEM